MFKGVLIIFAIAIICLGIFYYQIKEKDIVNNQRSSVEKQKTIYINGHGLSVNIADEPNEHAKGLSGKNSLAKNEGMLFIFPKPLIAGFWMKEMNFSIDIIWIDEANKIIGIEKDVSPGTYPKIFSPPSPIKYVLEVNAGWSDKNNIKTDDKMSD